MFTAEAEQARPDHKSLYARIFRLQLTAETQKDAQRVVFITVQELKSQVIGGEAQVSPVDVPTLEASDNMTVVQGLMKCLTKTTVCERVVVVYIADIDCSGSCRVVTAAFTDS